jgi:hypothetical protein
VLTLCEEQHQKLLLFSLSPGQWKNPGRNAAESWGLIEQKMHPFECLTFLGAFDVNLVM